MSALVESRGTPYAVRTPRFTALAVITDGRLREVVVRGLHTLGALDVVEAASVAEARARTRAVRDMLNDALDRGTLERRIEGIVE